MFFRTHTSEILRRLYAGGWDAQNVPGMRFVGTLSQKKLFIFCSGLGPASTVAAAGGGGGRGAPFRAPVNGVTPNQINLNSIKFVPLGVMTRWAV